jgi:hypothetical protein
MRRKLPYIALWLSLAYLVGALGAGGHFCFQAVRGFNKGVAKVPGGMTVNKEWVIEQADHALEWLLILCGAVGLGILFVALSALWVTLTPASPPTAASPARQDQREMQT